MDYGDIIRPGTEVKFKTYYGGYSGVIKAVYASESSVEYQVAYMHNGEVKTPYVPRIMFEIAPEPVPVGFQLSEPSR